MKLNHLLAIGVLSLADAYVARAEFTPCPTPGPVAKELFRLLSDGNSTLAQVHFYLEKHLVASDALNEQCETPFHVAIRNVRLDLLIELENHFRGINPNSQSENELQVGNLRTSFLSRFVHSYAQSLRKVLNCADLWK